MKRNNRYLLPQDVSYDEVATEVAELRAQGRSWPDIVAMYQESSPDAQLSFKQWRNLLQNALYRSGIKPVDEMQTETQRAKAEQERIRAVKAAYRDANHTPSTYVADYIGASHIIIGVIADTHFGSHWAQYTHLREFYETCAKAGVTDIYHAGDLDDGSETMHVGVMGEHHAYCGAQRQLMRS